MPKELYEEALADVKKVKQVAEDNAKRAVLEAVMPRIRSFIDQALMNEHGEPDGDELNPMPSTPGGPTGDGGDELMTDLVVVDPSAAVPIDAAGSAAAITPPDASGKVTLDIDALCSSEPGTPVPPPMFGTKVPAPAAGPETEYEISLESIDALKPMIRAAKKADVARTLKKITEAVSRLKKADKGLRSTRAYSDQIAQMISRVENIYDYVQEQVTDPAKKRSYETMLEVSFKDLTKLREFTPMSKKTKMNEADVTLKLTGLPDDIDLDTVGVDLITGEEDEEGMEGGDQQGGLDDLDMGGQGGQQGMEGQDQMESRELSDDTIVEIDEKMLRREIARMRNLREEHTGTGGSETKAQSWGNGSGGANTLDDFGGGKDEGDAHDQDITDLSPAKGARPLGEADEDLDEAQEDMDESQDQDDDQMDESDDLDQWIHVNQDAGMGGSTPPPPSMDQMYEDDDMNQIGDRRTRDDFGGSATSVPSKDKNTPAARHSEATRRLGFEKKLQENAKTRASALKKAGAKAHADRNGRRLAEVKKEYALVAKRFNESVTRVKKLEQIKAHAAKKLQEARSNSAAQRPAETQAVDSLRKKLAETNLFNAKLLFTNKLLQNEQLSAKQKAQVIKQLDQAKTVREAKLVYESLSTTLAGTSKPVNENKDRTVLGSGSRATRPASTQTLNEGYEAERWATLAGITKR